MSALEPKVNKFQKFLNTNKSKLSDAVKFTKKAVNKAKDFTKRTVINVGEKTPAIKKIVQYFWIFIQIIIILIIIYVVYLIIFGAYPRVLINLMFFRFFNQEPYDVFIKNNILWNSIKMLNSKNSESAEKICNTISSYCTTDFNLKGNKILPTNLNIYSSASNLDTKVNINYAQYASWSDHLKQNTPSLDLNNVWLQLDEESLRYLSEK